MLQRSIPVTNLTNYTHIRLAMHGSNLNSHDNLEVKLWDGSQLFAVPLKSMMDLPVWRPIYIDLRELANAGTINLATISRFEIAVVRYDVGDCEVPDLPGVPLPPAQHFGTLYLDEFAFVDLKPGARNRLAESGFESAGLNPPAAGAAAAALAARVRTSGVVAGLIPVWFTEPVPNYNTYVQAEALLVFTYEIRKDTEHSLSRSRTQSRNEVPQSSSLRRTECRRVVHVVWSGTGAHRVRVTATRPPYQTSTRVSGWEMWDGSSSPSASCNGAASIRTPQHCRTAFAAAPSG